MIEHVLLLLWSIAFALWFIETKRPAHKATKPRTWIQRAFFINAINLFIFYGVDRLLTVYEINWQGLLDASNLHQVLGAFIAYFIFTFLVYWWHRARHAIPVLWKFFHQLHHSPTRIEVLTAYYIHPLDMIANLLISNVIVFGLLNLSFEAAAWYSLITGIAGFVIHSNIRIPRQVGYVFQTPEMHRLHHKQNHHKHNYSDLVMWDMLFGTYNNPKFPIDHCGFDMAQEEKLFPMLIGKDLYRESKGNRYE